jgi:hypothetical protein
MPNKPLPDWLLYVSARLGCNPRTPGGTQIGIEYLAAPLSDTAKDPAVRPTAAVALDVAKAASTEKAAQDNNIRIDESLLVKPERVFGALNSARIGMLRLLR